MDRSEAEVELHALTNELANELIALTPEFMNEIQFEIVSTDDGGADIGLMEIHPEVNFVALSPLVYDCCSKYLKLVKRFAPGWRRSLINLRDRLAKIENRKDLSPEHLESVRRSYKIVMRGYLQEIKQ